LAAIGKRTGPVSSRDGFPLVGGQPLPSPREGVAAVEPMGGTRRDGPKGRSPLLLRFVRRRNKVFPASANVEIRLMTAMCCLWVAVFFRASL